MMNGHLKNSYKNINKSLIIKYLIRNEDFFINILDKFNNNYSKIPDSINFYPFIINDQIDSLLAFTSDGFYYPLIKDKYIKESSIFLNSNIPKIFSIYGHINTINELVKGIEKPFRNKNDYYVMKLNKKEFVKYNNNIEDYYCIAGNKKHFEQLKEIQYLYHKEEVYTDTSFYPYQAEMLSLLNVLKTKINYIVFSKKENIAVSKANINGESLNYYQLGGIYTRKEYRNKGLSKYCLNCLINYIFSNTTKKAIMLYVKKENLPAINLYKKLGFKIQYESILCYF